MGYERKARGEEKALVRRMLAGDEEAMEEFADGYFPGLLRFACSRLGGDVDLARDMVQATVCKALAKLSSYRGEAPLFTWLCACCNNEIAMHFRRQRRFPEIELDTELATTLPPPGSPASRSPEQEMADREASHLVHVVLDLLPPRYARALEWKYLESLPVNEIAERLAVRPKAAESLLTRARNAFRETYARMSGKREPVSANAVKVPASTNGKAAPING